MRKTLLAVAAAVAFSAPAHAVTVFSDGFEGESASDTTLNYGSFANWDVTDGTVDLIREPNVYGIGCASGSFCVDLDGSTGDPGVLTTKDVFTFNPYDVITVDFAASGSQRSGIDGLVFGLQLIDPLDFTVNTGVLLLSYDEDFGAYTSGPLAFDFSGAFKLFFRADPDTPGSDNIGLVLDDVSLDIAAVPEPASWAMMISGFGLVGGALRTRRRQTLAAA